MHIGQKLCCEVNLTMRGPIVTKNNMHSEVAETLIIAFTSQSKGSSTETTRNDIKSFI